MRIHFVTLIAGFFSVLLHPTMISEVMSPSRPWKAFIHWMEDTSWEEYTVQIILLLPMISAISYSVIFK